MKYYHLYICVLILFSACKKNIEKIDPEVITVDIPSKETRGNFKDYFSSSKIIALETNKNSIFSRIDRIIAYDNKFFILDRTLNGVFIFDSEGKFLNKIQNVGKGPGEYLSAMDFTINKTKNQIILYTDRPYNLFIYDIQGKYIEKQKLNNLFYGASYLNNKLILYSRDLDVDDKLYEYDLDEQKLEGIFELDDEDIYHKDFGMLKPYVIKDKNIHLCLPHSETIYEYNENGIFSKYYIDFGEHEMPDDIHKLGVDKESIFSSITKNEYAWMISNFRENKDYVTFSYFHGMIVIYSKKTKESKIFSLFINEEDQIPFYNYFAHDGDDNKLISIYQASQFKEQMDIYEGEIEPWKKVPEYIKEIAKKTSENDNPLLIIYTFKE